MMNKAWRTLVAVGLVGSFALLGGCVIGSSDDDSTGGSSGSGGGGTGGSGGTGATGGSGGATGGAGGATGGAGGATGGSGGFECEPATGTPPGTPGSCKAGSTDACEVCIEAKCCTEYSACNATAPGNPCFNGGPNNDGEGEIFCFQKCYSAELLKGTDPTDAKASCAGSCTTPSCGTIAGATSDLIACLDTNCLADCFQ